MVCITTVVCIPTLASITTLRYVTERWTAAHSGARVILSCKLPMGADGHAQHASWNLRGQSVVLMVSGGVGSTVAAVKKELAAQHLGGMPSNKFQLKHVERGFLKDKKTLAFHNLAGAVQIEVTLRKRRR